MKRSLSPEQFEQFAEHLRNGDGFVATARLMGLRPDYLYKQFRQNPRYARTINKAWQQAKATADARFDELVKKAFELIRSGMTREQACKQVGITMRLFGIRHRENAELKAECEGLPKRNRGQQSARQPRPKRERERPVVTPEQIKMTVDAIARGDSIDVAAKRAGMSTHIFRRERLANPEFNAAIENAYALKREQIEVTALAVLDKMRSGMPLVKACAEHGLRRDAFAWWRKTDPKLKAGSEALKKAADDARTKALWSVIDHLRNGCALDDALERCDLTLTVFRWARLQDPQLELAYQEVKPPVKSPGRPARDTSNDAEHKLQVIEAIKQGTTAKEVYARLKLDYSRHNSWRMTDASFRHQCDDAGRIGFQKLCWERHPIEVRNAVLQDIQNGMTVTGAMKKAKITPKFFHAWCKDKTFAERYAAITGRQLKADSEPKYVCPEPDPELAGPYKMETPRTLGTKQTYDEARAERMEEARARRERLWKLSGRI